LTRADLESACSDISRCVRRCGAFILGNLFGLFEEGGTTELTYNPWTAKV